MRSLRLVSVLFSFLLLLVLLAPLGAGEWSSFKRDLSRSALSPADTGPEAPSVVWSYETGDYVYSSPVLYQDRVYVGSGDSSFYCLEADTGDFVWSFPTGDSIQGSATVVDGRVYIGSYDSFLYCLDAETGAEVWSFEAQGDIFSSPAVDSGLVIFGSADGNVYALNQGDGSEEWRFFTSASVWASPAIEDGRVYIGSGTSFYCIDQAAGSLVWASPLGETIIATAAVQNQEVYVATLGNNFGGAVYLLDGRNGQPLWFYREPDGGGFFSSPAISERMVVIGSDTGKVTKLERDSGAFHWEYETGGTISSSPAIVGDKVYVGSGDGGIYCLDLKSGGNLWTVTTGDVVYSSPAVQDGKLWIGSWDNKLYCIGQAEEEPPLYIKLTEPSELNMSVTGKEFTIEFMAVGTLNDTISLYYAPERNDSQRVLLAEGTMLEVKGIYNWDTSKLEPGSYWVCAEITNGELTIKDWSEGSIFIPEGSTGGDDDDNEGFLPGFGVMELLVLGCLIAALWQDRQPCPPGN